MSLDRFMGRARLFPWLVAVYLVLVQGLHYIALQRSHALLANASSLRCRAVSADVLETLGAEHVRSELRRWHSRGRAPSPLALQVREMSALGAAGVSLLTPEGFALASAWSDRPDEKPEVLTLEQRRRLAIGEALVLTRLLDDGGALVSSHQPLLDSNGDALGVLRVDVTAPHLAQSDRQLRSARLLILVSLVSFTLLIVLFTRWLLKPLRLLQATTRVDDDTAERFAARDETGVVESYRKMIEQLREKEQELRRLRQVERQRADELQELNASIVDSMVAGVLVLDLSGQVRSANEPAREILRIAEGRIRGRPYRDVLPELPELDGRLQRCLDEGRVIRSEDLRLNLPGVGRRDVGLTLSPLRDSAGTRTGALCVVSDLTEVKRLQEQVRLQQSLVELGELSAGVAHEFRNSLGTILGFAKLVQRGGTEDVAEHGEAIVDEVGALRRVVDDFLRFANPTRLVLDTIDLNVLFHDLAKDTEARGGEKTIEVEIAPDMPTVTGDETLLRRVFTNLLRNAADAVGDPGRISVSGSTGARWITLLVDDDGPGIPKEERDRVFVPFFSRKESGTGLGLALARKVVVNHGGRIAVDESPMGGARFSVTLPLKKSEPPEK